MAITVFDFLLYPQNCANFKKNLFCLLNIFSRFFHFEHFPCAFKCKYLAILFYWLWKRKGEECLGIHYLAKVPGKYFHPINANGTNKSPIRISLKMWKHSNKQIYSYLIHIPKAFVRLLILDESSRNVLNNWKNLWSWQPGQIHTDIDIYIYQVWFRFVRLSTIKYIAVKNICLDDITWAIICSIFRN